MAVYTLTLYYKLFFTNKYTNVHFHQQIISCGWNFFFQIKFDAIDFPAVTFCNLNPFQVDKVEPVVLSYVEIISDYAHRKNPDYVKRKNSDYPGQGKLEDI